MDMQEAKITQEEATVTYEFESGGSWEDKATLIHIERPWMQQEFMENWLDIPFYIVVAQSKETALRAIAQKFNLDWENLVEESDDYNQAGQNGKVHFLVIAQDASQINMLYAIYNLITYVVDYRELFDRHLTL